ncbi:phosphate ABC transporter permease PstA [Hyphomonas johnsonii]|uniref:Phosphate transport system permease protein PstA n=1 Tax=Hyphomonas johnsonii MHS-2 TaxID=1280950 RepID=A0A059FVW1_9PROT|nr:phosphate ABC transporter permease PstA [Hyphomonas johnsonii]KCZ94626.1 phosphate ABC transporter permease [Hyphomonas johnsonii MHS-2]
MTNLSAGPFRNEKALARLRKRRAADTRFRLYGLSAIGFALAALSLLVFSIGAQALSAATYHVVKYDVVLDAAVIAPKGKDTPDQISRNVDGFYSLVRENLKDTFPDARDDRRSSRELGELMTRLAVLPTARKVADNPTLMGQKITITAPLNDDLDLYLKGAASPQKKVKLGKVVSVEAETGRTYRLAGPAAFKVIESLVSAERFEVGDAVDRQSILLTTGATTGKISDVTTDSAVIDLLTGNADDFKGATPVARLIGIPQSERNVTDQQIAWTLALKDMGRISRVPHLSLLTHTDSTYPELAGALAAIVGSLLTMFVTAFIAVPIGIFASVYLEEFAPRNRVTEIIEVNINNLAAVPSIVFGLLGAAVFLGFFGLPRSAPLVGGLVLALLTLPTIIIASRAALKSVPPSIRAAALGVGASKMQSVFHHVLPLAGPGIFTGAILGMARALGETAPLLLIGMVAFVADVPSGPTDEATALPVLIYSWSTNAERAWEPMTAAVIVILLMFLIVMNGIVVLLRRRFERRW